MATSADVDRLFLQAVLSRGVMSAKLAQALWERCVRAVNVSNNTLNIQHASDRTAWDAFISKINSSLDKLDFEFRMLHDEISGVEMYALVNRKGDEIAQMATDYTVPEITLFRAIVEQIMLAPNEAFSVSSFAALREINNAKLNMTKTQGEVVLASFVSKGWLLRTKQGKGRFCLSTRALLELLPYLKSTYPDEILECTICLEILTRGVACHTSNCKTRLHYHCFKTYRRRQNACPSCNKEWPREATDKPLLPVGEEAATAEEAPRRVRVRTPEQSDEEEEFVGDDGEDEPSQTLAPKKNKGSKNKKRAHFEDSMDVDDEAGPSQRTQGTQRSRRSSRR